LLSCALEAYLLTYLLIAEYLNIRLYVLLTVEFSATCQCSTDVDIFPSFIHSFIYEEIRVPLSQ